MTKKVCGIIGFILILLLLGAGFYYKKRYNRIKREQAPPYISLIGPVDMTDGIGRQTAELADLFSKDYRVNIISEHINSRGVSPAVSQIIRQNNKRLGKVVIYEDCVWKKEEDASFYLKTVAHDKQIRIAYSMIEYTSIPPEWVMELNLYFDAVVVPDSFLVEVYEKAGVKIPVFVIPLGLNLQDFLQKPLKTKKNPVFVFANFGASIDRKNQVNLVRAFAKVFGNNENVALHINARGGEERARKSLIDEILKQNCSNIYFTEIKLKQDAYVAFFQTIDCYVSPSKGEGFSIQPRQAMALGIPVIASDNTGQKTICSSSLVKSIASSLLEPAHYAGSNLPVGSQFNCKEEDLAEALVDVYQNYEKYLQKGKEARLWAASYDYTNPVLQGLYKTLVSPKRILLGKKNEIHRDYLVTTSKELYEKYASIAKKEKHFSSPYPSAEPTPVLNALKPLPCLDQPTGLRGIDSIYVINLDERPDRWAYVNQCFHSQNLNPNRVSAINGWKIAPEKQVQLIDKRAPLLLGGALGCLLTHVSIYKDAFERNFNVVWVCEDDIAFKQDAVVIPGLLEELTAIDPDWDVLYTDCYPKKWQGKSHRPEQPSYQEKNELVSSRLLRIHGRPNTHSMIFSKKGIAKAFSYFTHVLLWSPIDEDIHYIPGLREYCVKEDVVTSINDSSVLATDGSSDTQEVSAFNCSYN